MKYALCCARPGTTMNFPSRRLPVLIAGLPATHLFQKRKYFPVYRTPGWPQYLPDGLESGWPMHCVNRDDQYPTFEDWNICEYPGRGTVYWHSVPPAPVAGSVNSP